MSVATKKATKQAASNRKAYHDYHILEKLEAGIALVGTEVKSIRQGKVNLRDSFCVVKDGELFVRGMHISPYEKGNIFNHVPDRQRKLLMHKREIRKLHESLSQDGLTVIPLSAYFRDGKVKLELGVCRGKQLHDKRDADAESSARREIQRNLKQSQN